MIRATQCPHCFTDVLVSDSNLCPHCRKDVNDTRGVDESLRKLTVQEGQHLPRYCCDCDCRTERMVTIWRGNGPARSGLLVKTLKVLSGILVPGLYVLKLMIDVDSARSRRFDITIKVRIPQCEQCARKGVPKVAEVDCEHLQMSFVVHRGFFERVTGTR